MLVKDCMTVSPICGHPDMPVAEAQALMRQHNFRHLPILNTEGELVGLVTQRSLIQAIPAGIMSVSPATVNYALAKMKVHHIMVTNVVTIGEDVALEEAARVMADKKIGCLPVLRQGELVGIISDNDIFDVMVNLLGARRAGVRVTVQQPDRAGEVARLSTAIASHGGYLSAFATYPTDDPAIWASVLKVTNMPKSVLVETLESLPGIRIQDVREA